MFKGIRLLEGGTIITALNAAFSMIYEDFMNSHLQKRVVFIVSKYKPKKSGEEKTRFGSFKEVR